MAIIRNLAMTPKEMQSARSLPPGAAWMSCHFSSQGLEDLPRQLPPHALVILDDAVPMDSQDPRRILEILKKLVEIQNPSGILLDFQKPDRPQEGALALALQQGLSCPVAVSQLYAGQAQEGPVFLSLLPPHCALEKAMAPWAGREVWLEVGPASEKAAVTNKGTEFSPCNLTSPLPHCHRKLCCHYGIEILEDSLLFSLTRTGEDLRALTAQAEALGITRTVGLWQELRA